jgi:acetyl esterase
MSSNLRGPLAATLLVSASAVSAGTVPGPVLDPTTQAFVAGLAGSPPIYTLTPDAARAVLSDAQKAVPVNLPEASIDDRVLMVGPAGRTAIRVV